MGPAQKRRSRKQYVNYRLRILKELHIDVPSDEVIREMLDESLMSEVEVDNVFLGCIHRKR